MLSPALSALTPSPAPQPSANAAPAPAGADGAPQASFAQSLKQARQPKPPAAEHAKQDKAGPKEAADKAKQADDAQDHEDDDTPKAKAQNDDPAAALNQLLPGWNPAVPRADAAPRGEAAAQDGAEETGTAKLPAAGAARKRDATALAAGDARDARKPVQDAASQRFDAALSAVDGARADKPGAAAESGRNSATADAPLPSLQAAGSGTASATASTAAPSAAAAPPFEARLSAALGSPDFAPALGVQVSILVREGVQQARLHLNPAEMGPIAVQIALDGQNAQVHFQAEHADTRDALQASLPELAAALQDNGFTLSGGGVSDPRRDAPQQQGEGRPGEHPAGGVTDARAEGSAAAPAAAPVRAPRRQGVVDLYA
jgi:flagellar hook-length control protein FliK